MPQKGHANEVKIYADVSHEKTTRGPPTKKYISVRNIKAQITNMSANESSGFKTEYNVMIYLLPVILFYLNFLGLNFFLIVLEIYNMIYKTYHERISHVVSYIKV